MLRDKLPYSSFMVNFLVYFIFCLVPLAIFPDWGNSFTEPKLCLLYLLSIVLICQILRKRIILEKLLATSIFRYWLLGSISLLVLRIASFSNVSNWGLAFQSISLSLCLTTLTIFFASSKIKIFSFSLIFFPILAIVIYGALAMILFREVVFLNYSPFGSAVGLKNSLSVFVAQCLPFLFVLIDGSHERKQNFKGIGLYNVINFLGHALLCLSLWAIFANRTRSAWCMVIFYTFSIGVLCFQNKAIYKYIFTSLCCSLGLSLMFLNFIPNSLRWNSPTPYLDSFSTLSSIENSSGRDQLWLVASKMIAFSPWNAVGVGQAPLKWSSYIKEVKSIDPKLFAFLRPDLPLFNDYLQEATESGVIASLLFGVLVAGTPLFLFFKTRASGSDKVSSFVTLVCMATCLDAFVDYPFGRAEGVLLYGTALGFLMGGCLSKEDMNVHLDSSRGMYLIKEVLVRFVFASGIWLAIILSCMTIGFGNRKLWIYRNKPEYIENAFRFWPWDSWWRVYHLSYFMNIGEKELAREYVDKRIQAWPEDSESYYIKAKYYESNGNFKEALNSYRRAIVKIENGLCVRAPFNDYLKMLSDPKFEKETSKLDEDEIRSCR